MLCSVATCVGLAGLSSKAAAEPVLTERIRLQGGYIVNAPAPPAPRVEDPWIGAVPGVNLTLLGPKSTLSLDYQLIGALHYSGGLSELANFVTLGAMFTPSQRSTFFVQADGSQSTSSSFLISRPAGGSTVALFPAARSRLVTGRLSQGYSYELTPRLRFEQTSEAGVYTTLPPTPALDTFFGGLGVALEHAWRDDALGAELHGGFTTVQALPPIRDQRFVTVSLAPRWRHDWSRTISSLLSGGTTVVVSPDRGTKPTVAPSGRASILYTDAGSTLELSYTTGIFPSILTGQLLKSHNVLLHGTTALSQRHEVFVGSSIGYGHSKFVDLRRIGNEQEFDSFISDVDLTWQIKPLVQLFARYQFVAQIGETTPLGLTPSFLRDTFLVGIQFSSSPPSRPTGTQVGFPQRVDQNDIVRPGDRQRLNSEERVPVRREETAPEDSSWTTTPPSQDPREPSRWIHTQPAQPEPQPPPRRSPDED